MKRRPFVRPARDNPFAVHRVLRERYRLDDAGWATLLARLEAQRWRGAIVGPHGAGKTTLIEDLAARLEAQGWSARWVRLSSEYRSVPRGGLADLEAREVVLVDGAEQLSWVRWRMLRCRARHAAGLVITTHRAGRLPTLHRCATSPALLRGLVAALGVTLTPEAAESLHARHRGNLREALRELYDEYAARGLTASAAGVWSGSCCRLRRRDRG